MLRRIRNGRSDEGAATPIVMMGMVLALCAVVLLMSRIAQADDMRTRAQTGADAAALGVLAPLRDEAVTWAMEGVKPQFAGYWLVNQKPEVAADAYTGKNGVERVGDVHQTGKLGNVAKVSVATKECQLKREDELTAEEKKALAERRDLCVDNQGKEGIGRTGDATAIAKLVYPACKYDPVPVDPEFGPVLQTLRCGDDGLVVWSTVQGAADREEIEKLFKIRLVGAEDDAEYTGIPIANGPPGMAFPAGPDPEYNEDFGLRIVGWALKWLGTPYLWGGGDFNGPTTGCGHGYCGTGFDCSGLAAYAVYQASMGKHRPISYTLELWKAPRSGHVTGPLRPGDLVFFGADLGHVGIYMGNDKFVHAPSTGDVVKISTFSTRGNFAGAVRFEAP